MLRWARRRAKLTQRELAARTGIPQSTIARIESGTDPHLGTLSTLLRACGYDLEVSPRLGVGVDRHQLRANLELTPARRVARLERTVRNLRAAFGRPLGARPPQQQLTT